MRAIKMCGAVFLVIFIGSLLRTSSAEEKADDQEFKKLLDQYLKAGLVDYNSIKKDPGLLNKAVIRVRKAAREEYDSWHPDRKIAFLINAYNINVIKIVVDHYPIKKDFGWKALKYPAASIQHVPDVWDGKYINIFGENVSLNYIEHEILRKEFKEPRVHFALVCASIGCPMLRPEPYAQGDLDSQLDSQVKEFLADPSRAYYDRDKNALHLSPIFKWFQQDFEQDGGVVSFVESFIKLPEGKPMPDNVEIEWLDYDWSLNDQ